MNYQIYKEYETAVHRMRTAEGWKKYLDDSAYLYRYPFASKLLIAQAKPGAKAVATYEGWKKSTHCNVMRGRHGVAIPYKEGKVYVFDQDDVAPLKGYEKPDIWEVSLDEADYISRMLSEKYGPAENLLEAVEKSASQAVENYPGTLTPNEREFILASAVYQSAKRCGLNPDAPDIFGYVSSIEDKRLMDIGTAASQIVRNTITEIKDNVFAYRAERAAEEERRKTAAMEAPQPAPAENDAPEPDNAPQPQESAEQQPGQEQTAPETPQEAREEAEGPQTDGSTLNGEKADSGHPDASESVSESGNKEETRSVRDYSTVPLKELVEDSDTNVYAATAFKERFEMEAAAGTTLDDIADRAARALIARTFPYQLDAELTEAFTSALSYDLRMECGLKRAGTHPFDEMAEKYPQMTWMKAWAEQASGQLIAMARQKAVQYHTNVDAGLIYDPRWAEWSTQRYEEEETVNLPETEREERERPVPERFTLTDEEYSRARDYLTELYGEPAGEVLSFDSALENAATRNAVMRLPKDVSDNAIMYVSDAISSLVRERIGLATFIGMNADDFLNKDEYTIQYKNIITDIADTIYADIYNALGLERENLQEASSKEEQQGADNGLGEIPVRDAADRQDSQEEEAQDTARAKADDTEEGDAQAHIITENTPEAIYIKHSLAGMFGMQEEPETLSDTIRRASDIVCALDYNDGTDPELIAGTSEAIASELLRRHGLSPGNFSSFAAYAEEHPEVQRFLENIEGYIERAAEEYAEREGLAEEAPARDEGLSGQDEAAAEMPAENAAPDDGTDADDGTAPDEETADNINQITRTYTPEEIQNILSDGSREFYSSYSYERSEETPLRNALMPGTHVFLNGEECEISRPRLYAAREFKSLDTGRKIMGMVPEYEVYRTLMQDPRNDEAMAYARYAFGNTGHGSNEYRNLSDITRTLTEGEILSICKLFDRNLTNKQVAAALPQVLGDKVRYMKGSSNEGLLIRFKDGETAITQGTDALTRETPDAVMDYEALAMYFRGFYFENSNGFSHEPYGKQEVMDEGGTIWLQGEPYGITRASGTYLAFKDEDGHVSSTNDLFGIRDYDEDIRNEKIKGHLYVPMRFLDNYYDYFESVFPGIIHASYLTDQGLSDHEVAKELKARYEGLEHTGTMYAYGSPLIIKADSRGVHFNGAEINGRLTTADYTWDQFAAGVRYLQNDQRRHLPLEKRNEYARRMGVSAQDYVITEDAPAVFNKKERAADTIAAVRLVKELKKEGRERASFKEQEILAKYAGFGGLPEIFDEKNEGWKKEREELKELLTEDEYAGALGSTLNAHYTDPAIIAAMYEAIGNLGFKGGRILEPAAGIGNFFGMMPQEMSRNSIKTGVELDSVSGSIAQYLYPSAKIKIAGFETTKEKDRYDLAIGNVPFGQYQVPDKEFDKYGFSIHNYFFAKALSEVRPGGITAFITSRYTLDGKDTKARQYIADNAELLGAIRLPNNAFKGSAGTDVVSDIIFLKKREHPVKSTDEWINTAVNSDGMAVNSYFMEHPEMVLGKEGKRSGRFGEEYTVEPDGNLKAKLQQAIKGIEGRYVPAAREIDLDEEEKTAGITAPDFTRNHSYFINEGAVFYRDGDTANAATVPKKDIPKMTALIGLSDTVHELLDLEVNDAPDEEIKKKQTELNDRYDDFVKKYGRINDKSVSKLFGQDSSCALLYTLENLDANGKFLSKSDIFTKRTIRKPAAITHADTASESLISSLNEKGGVDMAYMMRLSGLPAETITKDLEGVIFKDPLTGKYQTGDEYLSGNVRDKLAFARIYAETDDTYKVNVTALSEIQPKELSAADIDVKLGASWIHPSYIEDFIKDNFKPKGYNNPEVSFCQETGTWSVNGKNDWSNRAGAAIGYNTKRLSAYDILERTLNLKTIQVFDTDLDKNRTLNKEETLAAAQKQEEMQQAFKDWIFKDPSRREDLVRTYNELFNSTRPREYDGSYMTFPGMSSTVELKDYQKNAVSRIVNGGNTLLAHCVGAGKTFEMAAAAMESKRLGLCTKSLFVVPNHLTEQWASDFLRLYPNAKVLTATKDDLSAKNRKRFCSKIATGDWDAVIIKQSQFEMIPLSSERQEVMLKDKINTLKQARAATSDNFSTKQIAAMEKRLEARLAKLTNGKKDDTVTFEQLGVDRLFVDEAHYYKNLDTYSKIQGLSFPSSKRATDMELKCRYMDELTGGKGVVFATGTPISNSITEMYTMMSYLDRKNLSRNSMDSFDSWASTFGEMKTAIELQPEGTGYRTKTRFNSFYNVPELTNMFREFADVKMADELKLPVPDANYNTVQLEPTGDQKELLKELSERAGRVRERKVRPEDDNMLSITNDGRKLALDQRLMDGSLPESPDGKTLACAKRVFSKWKETESFKGTQVIFCDQSTPKYDGNFNLYDDIKEKLTDMGIPAEQITFIHDAKDEKQKEVLFKKVNSGEVRVIIGSTDKMGAGTNIQERLTALHHLDVPWRPADIEQREGRIIRQGNTNSSVDIYRYVTQGTFDAYLWQTLENKQRFISQIMTSRSPVRRADDVDESVLSYAEVKALAADNPLIKEKMELDIEMQRLNALRTQYRNNTYQLEDLVTKVYPRRQAAAMQTRENIKADIQKTSQAQGDFSITIEGTAYADKKEAGAALYKAADSPAGTAIGTYKGLDIITTGEKNKDNTAAVVRLQGSYSYPVTVSSGSSWNIRNLDKVIAGLPEKLKETDNRLTEIKLMTENTKEELKKPFAKEEEYKEKSARLTELNALLGNSKNENNNMLLDEGKQEKEEKKKSRGRCA